jgi:hypothetical protein
LLASSTDLAGNPSKCVPSTPSIPSTTTYTTQMRVDRCDFSGFKVYPSRGKVYVRGDSKVRATRGAAAKGIGHRAGGAWCAGVRACWGGVARRARRERGEADFWEVEEGSPSASRDFGGEEGDARPMPAPLLQDREDRTHARLSASLARRASLSSSSARTPARSPGPRSTAACTRRASLRRSPRSAAGRT